MSDEAKVLTGLLERRALEAAFEELGQTADPELRLARAEAIAKRGDVALTGLLALLDTPDPALRGGLGLVATLLPRGQIVPALQAVARSRDRGDQARVAAASLLTRFLGEQAEEGALAPLSDPDAAALQSLRELVFAMDRDPLAILEFMHQLDEQPGEVADMLVDASAVAPVSPHVVTLLRILAQDSRPDLAQRALDRLGRMRTSDVAHALQSLISVLPPATGAIAERSLRKLRFSGVGVDDDDPTSPWSGAGLEWRVLLSPVDAAGTQFIWFIGERRNGRAVFLTYLLRDPGGIASAAIALDMPPRRVPHRGPVGELLNIDITGGLAVMITFLEAPVEEGVGLLRAALTRQWEEGKPPPAAFRLFNPLSLGLPGVDETAGAPVDAATLTPADYETLLHSPILAGWFAEERLAMAGGKLPESVFTPSIRMSYARRLHTTARWLKMAGEIDGATLVDALAQHFSEVVPRESFFVRQLCESVRGSEEYGKE